jgi:segregation and condensation protein B
MILSLKEEYDSQARGFQIVEVAGGFQIATRPQFAPYILKLNRHKRKNPLSIPALETLAIIAYKQPITRAEIEAIRGVDSSGVLHNLLELGLIKIAGRKEVVGHPPLYGTTEEFLKVFGLRQLADLPSIREIREMFEKREKEEKSPAPGEAQQPGAADTRKEKSDPSG